MDSRKKTKRKGRKMGRMKGERMKGIKTGKWDVLKLLQKWHRFSLQDVHRGCSWCRMAKLPHV